MFMDHDVVHGGYRGFLRTQDVSDYVSLWIRKNGDAGSRRFRAEPHWWQNVMLG
jgi:hypothetical protein